MITRRHVLQGAAAAAIAMPSIAHAQNKKFVLRLSQLYNEIANEAQPRSVAWAGEAGAAIFAAAWLWSLVTSLSVLREAHTCQSATPPKLEA